MAKLSREIAGAARENYTAAAEVARASTAMNRLTRQMSEATGEQKRSGEMIVRAIEAIALVSRQNLTSVEDMTKGAGDLAAQAERLRAQLDGLQG
jgi:methyl-accepting chemotaxis protein